MMKIFDWDPEIVPGAKLGMHSFQIIFSFVIWCLQIGVFVNDDSRIVGNNGWTFAVCFLSIPAWIYLIGTPRWPRTRKFAEPHAMLVVDLVFTVIWLSAFSTQAAYNTSGLCGGACSLSKAIVGLGVFETLAWIGSTAISIFTLRHYRFHGELPGYDKRRITNDNIDPDKAAFSMAPHDDEAYAPVQMDDHPDHHTDIGYGGSASGAFNDNPYRPGGRYGSADDDDPNRYGSLPSRHNAMFDSGTDYGRQPTPSMTGARQPSPYGGAAATSPYAPPTAHDVVDDSAPVQFPPADYDRTLR
ncbi:hypothetical protein SODALDRAFT_323646 [Sodiomyces alkalinus F11]|uniref:MARVEL domain-containing protein n=1 Tax=Sodiomyces alkalinus (strain CBS 110278 / VKM F-3762 / F11) TaxID=1314773 RepID=A0A3N2PXF8_SODAK|nr:hypothetical protein SODALDRAFT_323646 [Sodiomyces alkalinus F11]ROT39223.1 hypothetical protein SODALDRAFT_323646 [Sodiomyces alkalinus F11]